MRRLVLGCTCLVVTAALSSAGAPAAGATANKARSTNWSGYAISRKGVRFREVSASWIQPAPACAAGHVGFSALWIGLGGFHSGSRALEQVGTEADCDVSGQPEINAWYEVVPDVSHPAALDVGAGDAIEAGVRVVGHRVEMSLRDVTRGTSYTKVLRAPRVDISSAEWIVEAPSGCDPATVSSCRVLPLANFGSVTFSEARARTTGGRLGAIADRAWRPTAITLGRVAGSGAGESFSADAPAGGASPSPLAPTGTSFSVTYVSLAGEQGGAAPTQPGGELPPGVPAG
jgi:hypothetical protein